MHPQSAQRDVAVEKLAGIAEEARTWLFEAAAPTWAAVDRDKAHLFPERLTIEGRDDPCPHRLFVQSRHVFSYCEMGRLGWKGPWREMVEGGVDLLLANGFRADGFCIHEFCPDGGVFDGRADLYDQAFMLLALAHAGRHSSRAEILGAAEALGDLLDARWRHPTLGRMHEGEIAACPPFRQNPHMHLLEGYIAMHATAGGAQWRRRAQEMAELCSRCFVDPATGALLEYFDADLRPAAGEEGLIVEPGHCFEWAWLFEILAAQGLADGARLSDRMTAFARRHGVCPARGVVINEVLTSGVTRNGDARLWPQTERLKAALARFRRTGDPSEADEALAAWTGLRKFLEAPRRGLWRDKLRVDGSWIAEPAPGSSLYHITCAVAELLDTVEAARRRAEPAGDRGVSRRG